VTSWWRHRGASMDDASASHLDRLWPRRIGGTSATGLVGRSGAPPRVRDIVAGGGGSSSPRSATRQVTSRAGRPADQREERRRGPAGNSARRVRVSGTPRPSAARAVERARVRQPC
jgi:hypothetical protein